MQVLNNIEIIKKDTFNPKNNFFSARRSLKKKLMIMVEIFQ